MGFNESTHAFLIARYYARLTDAFGRRGEAAFVHAVDYYAGQRGRRMAQRAIRDGQPLTHATFVRYGELQMTDEVEPTVSEVVSLSPDYEVRISACPWHRQFEQMGCLQAGRVYCRHIDKALWRGFAPEIRFEAPSNLNEAQCCLQRVVGADHHAPPEAEPTGRYRRDFGYHCGHAYWSFREVVGAIFGAAGERVASGVLEDFAASYGEQMADALAAWKNTNFNVC